MEAKVLTALKGSIKHWEENTNNDEFDADACSAFACPLCYMFNPHVTQPHLSFVEMQMIDCVGCPIMEKTGYKYCRDTPYFEAQMAHENWADEDSNMTKDAFRAAAQKELDFLVSLLPEGERT